MLPNKFFYYCFFIAVLLGSVILGVVFFITHNTIIDFSLLERYKNAKPSILLDDEGKEWARFQADKREIISLNNVSNHIIHAFISAEDHNFFNHHGISWKGMIRSLLVNMYYGKRLQGASTITQQLVRLLFLDAKKTLKRKVKEQCYALLVEQQFSKEQILETYLNNVYFGCGIYGIEAACQRFWGISVTDCTLDQAAVLAAIVKSPGQYCPLLYPLSAQKRRNVVLHSMFKLGFITQQEYENATAQPINLIRYTEDASALHAKEYIRTILEQQLGKEALYTRGYTIQTTINSTLQRYAYKATREHLEQLRKDIAPTVDGALITIDVVSGTIKILIGGYDFAISQFNRAIQAKRQLGSIFKPLIYAAGLEAGKSFDHVEVDEPLSLTVGSSEWKPNNYTQTFQGPITLAHALSYSNNIVTIKLLLSIGYSRIIELAKLCQLEAVLNPYPSLALGCVDASLLEAVGMFNIFANNGIYVEPSIIAWIKDEWGNKIWKNNVLQHRVLSSLISGQVTKILSLRMERARKKWHEDWIECDAIGKTGTTNDSRTCWFLGSTPTYTTGIYIGCDDNRSLGHYVFGSTTGFPLWVAVNKVLPTLHKHFSYDSTLIPKIINSRTGRECSVYDPNAYTILVSSTSH